MQALFFGFYNFCVGASHILQSSDSVLLMQALLHGYHYRVGLFHEQLASCYALSLSPQLETIPGLWEWVVRA